MSLGYRRISAEEDKMRNVFDKGEYAFLVEAVEAKLTKSGKNKMLVVDLTLINNTRTLKIKDWIMLDMEDFEFKLRHFADTCGLIDKYDLDTLSASDFLGREGIAKVYIDEYEKDGEVMKCNRISDYVKSSNVPKAVVNDNFDDDIPI